MSSVIKNKDIKINLIEFEDLRNKKEKISIEIFAKYHLKELYPTSEIFICNNLKRELRKGNKKINKMFFTIFNKEFKKTKILKLMDKVGCPDIILINKEKKKIVFYEIKTENDNLRVEQINWIYQAQKLNFKCYVIRYIKPKKKKYKYKKLEPIKQKKPNSFFKFRDIIYYEKNNLKLKEEKNKLLQKISLLEEIIKAQKNEIQKLNYFIEELNKISNKKDIPLFLMEHK